MPTKKKPTKEDSWLHSEGKKLLIDDIRKGRITEQMDWKTVFHRRPEFSVGKDETEARHLFEGRLKSVRATIAKKDERATTELALLLEDRNVCPAPTHNHRGEPRWEGSVTQQLLKDDVKNKKHVGVKPSVFYMTRPEYYELYFPAGDNCRSCRSRRETPQIPQAVQVAILRQ
jgi:hypothetical protein